MAKAKDHFRRRERAEMERNKICVN
uniref:Uncharacterized protein n=1 Tax=Rhizophora mucronata TaxID=61149 RepID=A0A2P2KTY9_RHIMU